MSMLISLSGVNGVGKTTQVNVIKKILQKKDLKFITTQQLFQYFLLAPILRVLKPSSIGVSSKITKKNTNPILKLWFIFAFIDIWCGYFLKILPVIKKNDYVIADRDYKDMWVTLFFYGYLPSWAFKFLIDKLPKSDYCLLFVATPSTIESREVGFPSSYYKEQSMIYNSLRRMKNIVIIDANKSEREVTQHVIKFIEGILEDEKPN